MGFYIIVTSTLIKLTALPWPQVTHEYSRTVFNSLLKYLWLFCVWLNLYTTASRNLSYANFNTL